jgi:phytoene dehydrogenase-like protein
MSEVMVIGGGLAGMAAAIECAERGVPVELHEAARKLGGRARSLERDGFITNRGPHALYLKGPGHRWLQNRGLLPPLIGLKPTAVRLRYDGKTRRVPARFLLASARLGGPAPASLSFADWARSKVSPRAASLIEGYLTLPTYDGEPGRHAAAQVHDILARSLQRGVVNYVRGGWNQLVERIADRASDLGVDLRLGSRVERIEPGRTTIVATQPDAAARLLADPRMRPDGQAVALRDLGLKFPDRSRTRGPVVLIDLDQGVYLARYSALDPTLAPTGHDVLQCSAGLRPGEDAADAHQRIEAALDQAFASWRERAVSDHRWQAASPGHRDKAGTSWQQRPAIDRGDGVLLAGDWVAAPGILSEVCFTSATAAAERAAYLLLWAVLCQGWLSQWWRRAVVSSVARSSGKNRRAPSISMTWLAPGMVSRSQ